MPRISISIDGVVIREVTLAKDKTTLGRRAYNDIVVDNLAVSGEHAVLTMTGPDVQIEDLNSTNGTYVNAVAVQKRTLKDNDVIEVGGCRIHFRARVVAPAPGEVAAAPVHVSASGEASAPIALSAAPTESGELLELGVPVLRVIAGDKAGSDLPLQKVVTTIGKPGVAVAVVTRRRQGYVAASVMGAVMLNGEPLGAEAIDLHERDLLELGNMRLQFVRV